jgi:hypothetical protein
MEVDHRDKLIQIVRERGPVLPNDVHREIKTNILFASAMLSELVDSKILRLSNLKVGGSPLYYVPGQESSLQNWANKLHEKEKRAFELLRERKILRDIDEEPLVRACLRQIKDFAVPLEVNYESEVELFWKWYLISNEEAEPLIKKYLNLVASDGSALTKNDGADGSSVSSSVPSLSSASSFPSVSQGSSDVSPSHSVEMSSEMSSDSGCDIVNSIESVTFHVEFGEKAPPPKEESKDSAARRQSKRTEVQESLSSIADIPPQPKVAPKDDAFFDFISAFFKDNEIVMHDFDVTRKNSEADFFISLPSKVGLLNYFCRAKNKLKINDADLSSAYVQGQMKKLPVLFLTTGVLSKKAEDLAAREFKSLFVKHVEFEKKKAQSSSDEPVESADS